jgi:hypothetical protein
VRALDSAITDVGSLVGLALALVTVFTTARSTRAAERKRQTGLTRDDLIGELFLDGGLLVLTAGVLLAATPLLVAAVPHLAIGHVRGSLRLLFAVVWVLLLFLVGWQVTIFRATLRSTRLVWRRRT